MISNDNLKQIFFYSCVKDVMNWRLVNQNWKTLINQIVPQVQCDICQIIIYYPYFEHKKRPVKAAPYRGL